MIDDIFELLFRHAAGLAVDHLALRIHHNGRRDCTHPIEHRRIAIRIEHDGKIGFAFRHELLHGLRLLLDGRRATDAAKWTGVPRLTIGGGE